MKKIICILISVLLSFSLFGCSNNESASNNSASVPSASDTGTVSEPSKATVPEEFNDMNILEQSSVQDYAFDLSAANIERLSDAKVIATVNGYDYTSIGQSAWTVINVTVDEVLEGDVQSDAPLLIYTWGGYIPLRTKLGDSIDAHGTNMTDEEIDNTVVYEYSDSSALPQVNEKYVFYLVDGNDSMPEGSYERLGGIYGQAKVSADGTTAERITADGDSETYTINAN